MSSYQSTIERPKSHTAICTVTFEEAPVTQAEEQALKALGANVEVKGFRKGEVPADLLRDKVDEGQLLEETVRLLLPTVFEELVKEHELHPIIAPRVEALERTPLKVAITFIEKPEVTLKGIDKIRIDKKDASVDQKDLDDMVAYVLKQHEQHTEVDRAAQQDDRITLDFYGTDENGHEIENTRSTDYPVVIGSKTLIPGFEDALVGLKNGEDKSFDVTFPDNYQAEHLQGKPATFHVSVKKIEEVSRPELTDAFAKEHLHAESKEDFLKKIEESMLVQEKQIADKGREQKLLDAIREATKVDLPDPLIEEEMRELVSELQSDLEKQNMTMEQWIQHSGKTAEEVQKDFKKRGEERLTLRLGMQTLVDEKDARLSDEDMRPIVEEFLKPLTPEERKNIGSSYEPGQQAYEQLKWQKSVERVIEEMLSK